MILSIFFLCAGSLFLYGGAESLVRGSSSLALRLGLSSLVVGLTVVAFGTSAPELAASVNAGLFGKGDIAIGNVLGSNIINICLILGIAALVYPLHITRQILKFDMPILLAACLLFGLVFINKSISRPQGLLLFAAICAYISFSIVYARKHKNPRLLAEYSCAVPHITGTVWRDLSLVGAGCILLPVGSWIFVKGAIAIAAKAGLSDAVIGLTIVAAGTSLPELATSVVATMRREPDIAIGNVVGSNIFNLLCIPGIAALVRPVLAPHISFIDIGIMSAICILLFIFMKTGYKLARWEGALLLVVYAGYLTYLLV